MSVCGKSFITSYLMMLLAERESCELIVLVDQSESENSSSDFVTAGFTVKTDGLVRKHPLLGRS